MQHDREREKLIYGYVLTPYERFVSRPVMVKPPKPPRLLLRDRLYRWLSR